MIIISGVSIEYEQVTLLGDSIIDNKIYVEPDEFSVLEHLEHISDDEFLQMHLMEQLRYVLSSQLDVSEDDTHIVLSLVEMIFEQYQLLDSGF